MVFKNTSFFISGLAFLALAKAKNQLLGYSTPKPFDVSESARCFDYDISVVDEWLTYLTQCTHDPDYIEGKTVLELGPGSDLGIGLYLLSKGCSTYNACDVNDLMKSTPYSFYEHFFSQLAVLDKKADIKQLEVDLRNTLDGKPSRLNYVVRDDFDLVSAFGKDSIDIVFSQAAFEHFDDIDETVSNLTKVCKSGAKAIVEVDLKAHSRWIRSEDPNNIYRYPEWLYRLFWFSGSPNRVRPYQYEETFERHGWKNIKTFPFKTAASQAEAYSGMNKNFRSKKNQMEYLSIFICAEKA